MKITPVILCGGSGTRLWPLSRHDFPKQFLKFVDDFSLFQQTVSRIIALENENIQIAEFLIITNENHRFLVLEQLSELKIKVPIRVLLEPEAKNTAPALTLASLASQDSNKDSILVVCPADHYVKDIESFIFAIQAAINVAEDQTIITLGISPYRPETGFGYIHYVGESLVKEVLSFKEKPNLSAAKSMIEKGNYAWNAGIFILKSNTWLNAIQRCNNEIYKAVVKAWKFKNTDHWFERADKEYFKRSPADSIDYSVMENAKMLEINVNLILLDAGWSDLGSFDALYELEEKDGDNNIFKGDVVSLDARNTIAISTKKNISLLGVNDLIVIETSDSVLVANKDNLQSIKKLVKILEKNHQYLLKEHTRVNRPWGWFETLEEGDTFKVKCIHIYSGKSISLQKHQHRAEHWVVVKGDAVITKGNKKFNLSANQSTYIEKNQIHQITNKSDQTLMIIEVQSGEYLGEDDIERLEDKYGR